MSQLFFLEIVYMVLGALLLLSDSHGVKYPLLLSLRHLFRISGKFRLLLIVGGIALMFLSVFLPYEPGPMVLGDLLVSLAILFLVIWYGASSLGMKEGNSHTMLDNASTYVEKNKMVLGYVTIAVAVVHFIVPMCVLL